MKINTINNTTFGKILVAKGNVIKNGAQEKINIYQLEEKVDDDYFKKAWEDENWRGATYLGDIEAELIYVPNASEKIYSMEDSKGNILGLSEITSHKDVVFLDYLETAPRYSINNKSKRTFKYIGETMISFIASLCKRDNKDLDIPDVAERQTTEDFYYEDCGFMHENYHEAKMYNKRLGNLIAHNEQHTGSRIELIG